MSAGYVPRSLGLLVDCLVPVDAELYEDRVCELYLV